MVPFGRLAFVTLISLELATTPAAGQSMSAIPSIPVSTVIVPRELVRLADTTSDVVFVVRDLHSPDRPLGAAWVGVGAHGTDVRAHPARTAGTRADGTARLAGLVGDTVDVVVLRIGYGAIRFSVRLAPQCRQTIEIYIATAAIIDGEVPGPAPGRPRVVLTTCAPTA